MYFFLFVGKKRVHRVQKNSEINLIAAQLGNEIKMMSLQIYGFVPDAG
jgi:hypothetical protein